MERCQICGDLYPTVYEVPNEVWEKIKPKGKKEGAGLLCIPCADDRAREKGIILYWSAKEKEFT
jgi:hypothetical protein